MSKKKYLSPMLLADIGDNTDIPHDPSEQGYLDPDSFRNLKDDISTSFVYGDDNYEEEYVVPDVIQEVTSGDIGSEEISESID